MNDLKVAGNIFLKRKPVLLLTILMLATSSFMIYTVTRSVVYVNSGYDALTSLIKENVFVGNNQATDAQLNKMMEANPKGALAAKAQSLMRYVDENYKYSISWSVNSELTNKRGIIGDNVQIRSVSPDFPKFYSLPIEKGTNFNNQDFNSNSVIPVIVGSLIAGKYPLNKVFMAYNGATGKKERYIVKGILKANTGIQSIYSLDSSKSLNSTIIRPISQHDLRTITPVEMAAGMQDLIVWGTNKRGVNKISHKFAERNLLNIKFYSIKDNIADFLKGYKQAITTFILFSLSLLAFACVLVVWNTKKSFSLATNEIALRLSVGMNKHKFGRGIILVQFVIALLSVLPLWIFVVIYKYSLTTVKVMGDNPDVGQRIIGTPEFFGALVATLVLILINIVAGNISNAIFQKKSIILRLNE